MNSAVGELCKRALQWPQQFSNCCNDCVGNGPRKLGVLHNLLDGREISRMLDQTP